jgi:putative tryptophan/tyrosine transport system substrate-binding protein
MFTATQYRTKTAEYTELLKTASSPAEAREFRKLEQSYRTLAENEEWMADNLEKTNSPGAPDDWYGYIDATGAARRASVLYAGQLKLARELVPAAALVGVLVNPDSPNAALLLSDAQTAARTIGQPIHILSASSEGDVENAFVTIGDQHIGALVVTGDAFFNSQRDRIVALATRHQVPTIYDGCEDVVAAGLAAPETFYALAHRKLGINTSEILNGASPAQVPTGQPTKFAPVIDLATAKTRGLALHPSPLAPADEVVASQ